MRGRCLCPNSTPFCTFCKVCSRYAHNSLTLSKLWIIRMGCAKRSRLGTHEARLTPCIAMATVLQMRKAPGKTTPSCGGMNRKDWQRTICARVCLENHEDVPRGKTKPRCRFKYTLLCGGNLNLTMRMLTGCPRSHRLKGKAHVTASRVVSGIAPSENARPQAKAPHASM